jgi:hypothetical protein
LAKKIWSEKGKEGGMEGGERRKVRMEVLIM